MPHFTKLRLSGFKSFVDKTELDIGSGLNGIIGPNGCGKSNLVEALRWVMGGASARKFRSDGMEDVIFSGTSRRPARNSAEVSLILDNNDPQGSPAMFENVSEIEIKRHIERDKGSTFRLNGKAVRARDVDILLNDIATGASSSALVSQGKVADIINSKPVERRKLIEEAAGVSGLYARRKEAELRLNSAEKNLERVADQLGIMRTQCNSLKRQASQAERYSRYSDDIQNLEMSMAWLETLAARKKASELQTELEICEKAVAEAIMAVKVLSEKDETVAEKLPELRKKASALTATINDLTIRIQRTKDKQQVLLEKRTDLAEQLATIERDRAEWASKKDTAEQEEKIVAQKLETTTASLDREKLATNGKQETLQTAKERFKAKKQELQELEDKQRKVFEQKSRLDLTIENATARLDELAAQESRLQAEIAEIDIKQEEDELSLLNGEIQALRSKLATASEKKEKASLQVIEFETHYQNYRDEAFRLQSDINSRKNEIETLESHIEDIFEQTGGDKQSVSPVLNELTIQKGYEKAVRVALGELGLMAGVDIESGYYWDELGKTGKELTQFIEPVEALGLFIEGPANLQKSLNNIGVVTTQEQGFAAFKTLEPGQSIVSTQGDLWRWDGLVAHCEYTEGSSQELDFVLKEKNRLESLNAELETMMADLQAVEKKMSQKGIQLTGMKQQLEEAEEGLAEIKRELEHQERRHFVLSQSVSGLIKNLDLKKQELAGNREQITQMKDRKVAAEKEKKALLEAQLNEGQTQGTEIADLNEAINALESQIQDQEELVNKAQYECMRLQSEHATLSNELKSTIRQKEDAERELAKLVTRESDIHKTLESLNKNKEDASSDQANISDMQYALEKACREDETLQETLHTQEKDHTRLRAELRDAETALSDSKESRATIQANMVNAKQEISRIKDTIEESFSLSVQQLEEKVYSLFDEAPTDLGTLRRDRDDLIRKRDQLGSINLRAKEEYDETKALLDALEADEADLTQAIAKLRSGISKLNSEAKERLNTAFETINAGFADLFTRLFGGGNAHLKLVESDDPLEAGLDIFAQPPGKSLQSLKLLSGGEQTLTSLALIFAIFRCNPSPICVLDEVDAPLDDSNVDRVCSLLEDITKECHTRFLVITHHAMTMSRMDRLYGVTMSERGISKLVSVDMNAIQETLPLQEQNRA